VTVCARPDPDEEAFTQCHSAFTSERKCHIAVGITFIDSSGDSEEATTTRLRESCETRGAMLRGLFQRKPKHERLEEEPEVRFKGLLVSERDLGYTYVQPGGKTVPTPDVRVLTHFDQWISRTFPGL